MCVLQRCCYRHGATERKLLPHVRPAPGGYELKILVACEESQAVTIELRRLGHEAYSCDIIPCSGGHPEWHIMQNVLPLLNGNCSFKTMDGTEHSIETRWDIIIAFPPCTKTSNAGARHLWKMCIRDRFNRELGTFNETLIKRCFSITQPSE